LGTPSTETARRCSASPVIDDEPFQTLIEQVRDLHRRTDELHRSKVQGVHANVRARLSWRADEQLGETG
jgi:hypothetical protein